jgi:hypothetical protein
VRFVAITRAYPHPTSLGRILYAYAHANRLVTEPSEPSISIALHLILFDRYPLSTELFISSYQYYSTVQSAFHRSVPGILVRVDDQVLHKPDRLNQRIRLDMLVDGMDPSSVLSDKVPESVDVAGQAPVSLGIGISTQGVSV